MALNTAEWISESEDRKLVEIFDNVTLKFGPPTITFRAWNKSFLVHKKVLEKYSQVMRYEFSDGKSTVKFDEEYVDPEVVPGLLTWTYYDFGGSSRSPIQCSDEDLRNVCYAAHYLEMPKLVKVSRLQLASGLNFENFYEVYRMTNLISLPELRLACWEFFKRDPKAFFESPYIVDFNRKEMAVLIKSASDHRRSRSVELQDAILFSLVTWTDAYFDDRICDVRKLLKLVPPETLSSDALSRFMKTEVYEHLLEADQERYYVDSDDLPDLIE